VFDDALVNEGVEFLGPIAGDEEFGKFFAAATELTAGLGTG